MIADVDLPVWSIGPNWSAGILETLEWLTDVMKGDYGTEQRRALRLSPRRTFEVLFTLTDQERSFLDLWLHSLGSDEFMLPLWHDRAELTAGINIGATVLPCDTTFREFEVGGLGMIVGPDAFTYEKVQITGITDTHLAVAAGGVTRAYPAGTAIHALRRARLEDQSGVAAITSRVGQGTLRFDLNRANDLADEGTWDVVYGGYPILLEEPNRREDLKLTFDRNQIVVDNGSGLRELTDSAGRAFAIRNHLLTLVGRAELFAFRQLAYRLRGQQGSVWLPSFNQDVELTRDRLAADAVLDIKQIGYAYTGGAVSGRDHLLIGNLPCRVTGTAAALADGEERLVLSAPLGEDIPAGEFGSFLETCRQSADAVQIHHITDSDGVSEATLSFVGFRDERTTPDPLDSPIPAAEREAELCGTPDVTTCVPALSKDDPGDPTGSTPGEGPGSGGGLRFPDGDGGLTDPTVTSSTLMGIVVRSPVDTTGTGPFGANSVHTPADIAGAPHKLLVPSPVARDNLLVDFPELATMPWTSVGSGFFYGTLGAANPTGIVFPDGSNPHGPTFDFAGGDAVWYSNTTLTPAQDMWLVYGGSFANWNTYATELNDPNAYHSAYGGPYREHEAWWDHAQTIPKTLRGKGTILSFHDFSGVNPDQGPIVAPDTITPDWGRGNYDLTTLDFKKYYGANR